MSISNVGSITVTNASYRFFSKPVAAIAIALTILAALGAYLYHKGYFSFTARNNANATDNSTVETPEGPDLSLPTTSPETPILAQLHGTEMEFVLQSTQGARRILPRAVANVLISLNAEYFQFGLKYSQDNPEEALWMALSQSRQRPFVTVINNKGEIILERVMEPSESRLDLDPMKYYPRDLQNAILSIQENYIIVNGCCLPRVVYDEALVENAQYIEIYPRGEWRIFFEYLNLTSTRNAIGYNRMIDGSFERFEFGEPEPTPMGVPTIFSMAKCRVVENHQDLD